MLDETLRFFVKATGKDEASMRQQLTSKKPDALRRSREFQKTRAEKKQRFDDKKKEAWDFLKEAAKSIQTQEQGRGLRGRVQAKGDE